MQRHMYTQIPQQHNWFHLLEIEVLYMYIKIFFYSMKQVSTISAYMFNI